MRDNLILTFVCSDCGERLDLVLPEDETAKAASSYQAGHPTGAACRYIDAIHVKPCSACILEVTAPARKLVDAMAELSAIK